MPLSKAYKRFLIATKIGWKVIENEKYNFVVLDPAGIAVSWDNRNTKTMVEMIETDVTAFPDFFTNLNATNFMEKYLKTNKELSETYPNAWVDYTDAVHEFCDNRIDKTLHASAAIRAQAFGIILNLWTA